MQEAVEDIITRGVGEIRKNAFGDDLEDAKNLPWSREQAWALMKKLSTKSEVCVVDFNRHMKPHRRQLPLDILQRGAPGLPFQE